MTMGAIICRRYERGYGACAFCGKPGNKLCDFPLREGKTCDARMCVKCAAHVEPDTDYCPIHRGKVKP
jgi:hypothetical protein